MRDVALVIEAGASDDSLTDAIEMLATLEILAAAGDEERKFSMVAYSGGKLPVAGFPVPVVVDLTGLEASSDIPILIDHLKSVDATLGISKEIINNGKSILISGVITGQGDKTKAVLSAAAAGHKWQASIGAQVLQAQEISAGQTVKVNGQTFSGPLIVARRAVLRETSVLPMGADSSTSVNLAASAAKLSKGAEATMNKFQKWLNEMGVIEASLSDDRRASLQLAFEAETGETIDGTPVTKPVVVQAGEAMTVPAFDVQASLADLNKQVASQLKKHSEIQAKAAGHPDIAAKAIEEDWSVDKVELETMKAAATRTRPTSFGSAQNEEQNMPLVLEAAVCTARGHKDVEKNYDDKTLQAAHTLYRGQIGLQQMILQAASMLGMSVQAGMKIHQGNLREVLEIACPRRQYGNEVQAAFSTLSLPGILSNVANKELLSGYMEVENTWREVSRTKTVSDFKAVTSYRMLDDMEYEQIGPAGEIKSGSISEESYTRQVDTYAKMFALTRTNIINDDMGAFDDLRDRIGQGAAKKLNRVFWTKWLAAALWSSGNGNYITGATTTLLLDGVGLGLALDAFDDLRTPAADGSKKPGGLFGGSPSILLTPGGGISRVAETLHVNTNLGTGANGNANIYGGRYKPVKSVFLNDSSISGGSALAWYLLRNPAEAAAIVVSFLNGVETPTVENADADFSTLGIQFRGFHDFGVDEAEPLAGVKSKGAS